MCFANQRGGGVTVLSFHFILNRLFIFALTALAFNQAQAQAQMRAELGVFALLVDAKDAAAQRFYLHHGFTLLPGETRRMFVPVASLAQHKQYCLEVPSSVVRRK